MPNSKPRKSRFTVTHIIGSLLLMLGVAVALYPFYIGSLNDLLDQQRVAKVQRENEGNAKQRLADLKRENTAETSGTNSDPFSGLSKKATLNLKHDMVGTVTVPKLALTVPVFKTLNDASLEVGSAVVPGSSMPTGGRSTHTVVAGHRGLVDRRLFSDLNRVKKGDLFVFKIYGKHLAYRVFQIQVVEPTDTSTLRIKPGQDIATLLTCTPYMINSHRLLITGKRVAYTPTVAKDVSHAKQAERWQQLAILIGCTLAILAVLWLMMRQIYRSMLKRRNFRLQFQCVDAAGQPAEGQTFSLRKRNGKTLYRDGQPLMVTSDGDGNCLIENLPGALYRLVWNDQSTAYFRVGVKRLKQSEMAFYPSKRQAEIVSQQEGQWRILVDR